MRTYRKRAPEQRHCVHCAKPFESAHKRRIYCGNSCSTLAYYARKAAARGLAGEPPGQAAAHQTTAEVTPAAEPTPVTLALNAQNLALFTAGPLLAEGFKQAIQLVGKLLAPTPQAGPSSWLPALFKLIKHPLVPLHHPDWDEPRFFVLVPWKGEVFYYRAAHDLLFWQAPGGAYMQVPHEAAFTQLLAQLAQQKSLPAYQPPALPAVAPLLLKELG
jgi:hypothetical protein